MHLKHKSILHKTTWPFDNFQRIRYRLHIQRPEIKAKTEKAEY